MSKRSSLRVRIGLSALFVAAAVPAMAFTQYDYLFDSAAVRNDNQMFLNLTVTDSGVARVTLEPLLPRIRYVENDLPVLLFLARQSGRPVGDLVDLRSRGYTWSRIFSDVGMRYDALFTDFGDDPGPRYRTVWTTWRTRPTALRLTDYQVRDLVQVQYGHRLASVPVVDVIRARNRGRTPVVFVAERRGRTYSRLGVPPGHGGVPPGHGGVPPGQVKNGVAPGHRRVVITDSDRDDRGNGKRKDKGGRGRGNGKGNGKGGGKGKH